MVLQYFEDIGLNFREQVAHQIKSSVSDLGKSCVELVSAAGVVQSNPRDTYAKKELSQKSRGVVEKVMKIWF